jgi:hypothetical protein
VMAVGASKEQDACDKTCDGGQSHRHREVQLLLECIA